MPRIAWAVDSETPSGWGEPLRREPVIRTGRPRALGGSGGGLRPQLLGGSVGARQISQRAINSLSPNGRPGTSCYSFSSGTHTLVREGSCLGKQAEYSEVLLCWWRVPLHTGDGVSSEGMAGRAVAGRPATARRLRAGF